MVGATWYAGQGLVESGEGEVVAACVEQFPESVAFVSGAKGESSEDVAEAWLSRLPACLGWDVDVVVVDRDGSCQAAVARGLPNVGGGALALARWRGRGPGAFRRYRVRLRRCGSAAGGDRPRLRYRGLRLRRGGEHHLHYSPGLHRDLGDRVLAKWGTGGDCGHYLRDGL